MQRLQEKLAHVRSECHVDYALFGGYPGDDPDEVAALAEAGIVALKLFTGGVAPPGMYPGADTGQMLDCMRQSQAEGLIVVVHCENAEIVDFETRAPPGGRVVATPPRGTRRGRGTASSRPSSASRSSPR